MSWREILGVAPSAESPPTHNSQNAQKPTGLGNCADIADSARGESEQENSKLLEVLADACRGLDITPAEVKQALAAEDIDGWRNGAITADAFASYAGMIVQRRKMDQGKRPEHYTEPATCKNCGPVWLWFSGTVLGCPWCRNATASNPIPRPSRVRCEECRHFQRTQHAHLGHCSAKEPEPPAGLCNSDKRFCERFLPVPTSSNRFLSVPGRSKNEVKISK